MKKIFMILVFLTAIRITYGQTNNIVVWSYNAERIDSNNFMLNIQAEIDPGWLLFYKPMRPEGPVGTSFSFFASEKFSLIDGVLETKPLVKYDEALKMPVAYFEHIALFQQRIKVVARSPFSIKGKLRFMAGNGVGYLAPRDEEFEIPINVKPF